MESLSPVSKPCKIKNEHYSNRYKATTIWNEITNSFRIHISCKTKRRNLKTYSNCFTGSAAVDVLHAVLIENQNFTRAITKDQAVKLLQKFLSEHVIETVNGEWRDEIFSASNRLYRFNKEFGSTNSLPSHKSFVSSPPFTRRFATSIHHKKESRLVWSVKNYTRKREELRFLPKCILSVVD